MHCLRLSPFFFLSAVAVFLFGLENLHAMQSDEVRPSTIEELAKDAENPEKKQGVAKVFLSITTDDGLPFEPIEANVITVQKFRNGSSRSRQTRTLRPKMVHELSVESGSVSIYLQQRGFAVCEALREEQLLADEEIVKTVRLERGVERTVKVLDDDGTPIENAEVQLVINGTSCPFSMFTDSLGTATVNLMPERANESILISKEGWTKKTISKPLSKDHFEVNLSRRPETTITLLDSQGDPIPNAKVWLGAASNQPGPQGFFFGYRDNEMLGIANRDGVLKTRALSDETYFTVVAESDSHRGVFGSVQVGKDHTFTMSRLKKVRVGFKGVPEDELPSVLERSSIQQRYGDSCQLTLPSKPTPDGLAIETSVVEGRELTIRHYELSTLYETEKYKHDTGEIEVDLTAELQPPSVVNFVFENDGERVDPKGVLHVRTMGKDGVWRVPRKLEIENGRAEFETTAQDFRVENDGLFGFAVVGRGETKVQSVNGKPTAVVAVELAGAIVGTIADANGKLISTEVKCEYLYLDRERSPFATTVEAVSNKDGKFLLTPIPLGTKVSIKNGSFLGVEETELTIDEENPIPEIALVLPNAKGVTVKARSINGKPASGVKVLVRRIDSKTGASRTSQKNTNKDGNAFFEGLLVGVDEYSACVAPKADYQVTPFKKIMAGESLEFTVHEGQRLEGVVVDEEGKPVPEFVVTAKFGDQVVKADSLTDENGKFLFTRLPKQEVRVFAAHRWESIKSDLSDKVEPGSAVMLKLVVKQR